MPFIKASGTCRRNEKSYLLTGILVNMLAIEWILLKSVKSKVMLSDQIND
uniref:Uncharacterized protein n=1 Tax=Octopus bimaculoides TaxID=37653 RepID=A0A0L8I830_OCTBM